jgi:biotin carboxyl carrier protein
MQRRYRVNEQAFTVRATTTAEGIHVESEKAAADLSPRGLDGREVVWIDQGQVRRYWVARLPSGAIWVGKDGRSFLLTPEEERRKRGADAQSALSTPMPGKLVRIVKGVGESVQKGETLLVVEAMKMELPIKAPRDGVIQAIHAQVGEKVSPNTPLLALE